MTWNFKKRSDTFYLGFIIKFSIGWLCNPMDLISIACFRKYYHFFRNRIFSRVKPIIQAENCNIRKLRLGKIFLLRTSLWYFFQYLNMFLRKKWIFRWRFSINKWQQRVIFFRISRIHQTLFATSHRVFVKKCRFLICTVFFYNFLCSFQ